MKITAFMTSLEKAKQLRQEYVYLLKTCSPNYNGDTWASVKELDEARDNWIRCIQNEKP